MPVGVYDRKKTVQERFWEKVDKRGDDDCWLWKPLKGKRRYGYFWNGKRYTGTHKYSLEVVLGRSLVSGEMALHTCDNPPCVNPRHLVVGTGLDNMRDKMTKGRGNTTGSNNAAAKLDENKVVSIRESYASGSMSSEDLAKKYKVSAAAVMQAITGKTWKHAGGPISELTKERSGKWISEKMKAARATKKWWPRKGKTARKY